MPSSVVQIEGVGNVQFPDSMSDADIGQAAHKLYTGAAAAKIQANPPSVPPPNVPMMQESGLAHAMNPSASIAGTGETNFVAENPDERGKLLTAAAIGAGGPTLGPTIAKKAAPYILPAIASYGINKARELPVVGPVIKQIPFAEMIPWMFAGGKEKPESPILDATRENVPYAGEKILPAPDATGENLPYAGERAPAPTPKTQSTILSPIETAHPEPPEIAASSQSPKVALSHSQAVTQARAELGSGAGLSDLMKRADEIQRGAGASTTASIVSPIEAAQTPRRAATPQAVEQALNESLGGKPLVPGVSLRNQPAAQAAAAAGKLPAGFTPVESSVLKGYKYDPAAKEFTAITNSGQSYTHGEVTPDQVKSFENADSQGKAWTEHIRNNNPLVKKNGGPVKPATMDTESGVVMPKSRAGMNEPETETHSEDLTEQLKQSLARKKKP
jgi:hypothetical protein